MSKFLSCFAYAILLAIPTFLCGLYLGLPIAANLISTQRDINPERFNTSRQPLPENALESQIFPQQIGNYILQPPLEVAENSDFKKFYFREYEWPSGGIIRFQVGLFKEGISQTQLLSSGRGCGDGGGTTNMFSNKLTPYAYAICGTLGYSQHTFNWINGNWFLSASSASTLQSDGNMLLEFVNQYQY